MKKKFLLLLALSSMVFCLNEPHKSHIKQEEEEDAYELLDEALDLVEVNIDNDIDTTPLEIDSEDPYTELTKAIYDFDGVNSNYVFNIIDKNMVVEPPYTPNSDVFITEDDVSFYDNRGQTYDFSSFIGGNGEASLSFSPLVFNPHRVYYLELKNDNLVFEGKDDNIRRLTFYTMNRGLPSGKDVDYKDDIVDIDSTRVYYYDEDGYSPYFVYQDELDIDANKTFRIRNPLLEEDDIETVYGKVISINKNPNGAGYMVRYNPAKGEDIYDRLTISDSKGLSDEDSVVYYNDEEEMEEQIAQNILHNPSMVTTVYAIFNAFDVKPVNYKRGMMDWGSRIDIKFNTSYDPNTSAFTFSTSASFTFYPEDNLTLTIKFGFKKTWKFDVTASVEIETAFIIPVGIDYTIKVIEDTQKEYYFGICLSYDGTGEYDEKKTDESINNAIADAFKDDGDWHKRSVFTGADATATKGGMTYPVFKITCTYFLPIEIYFDVEFYWELVPTVEAIFKYSSHTQRVDLCVSNTEGSDPSSDSATKTNSDLSFTFIGKVHFEVGFRVSLGVDIVGLYKFFHFEVYLTIYGAIDISGYLFADISWSDDEPVCPNMQIGCKFEISCGLRVGIDLYLLFGGYNHEWPIVSVVLFGVSGEFPFQEFVHDVEDMYIKQSDYNATEKYFNLSLGERHLLTTRYFNNQTFTVDIKDMNYDDKVKALYGAFVPNDVTIDIFSIDSITVTEGAIVSTLSVSSDGHLLMDTVEGQDNFVAEIVVRANEKVTMGKDLTKTIIVHFENTDRQDITIDGVEYGSFVEGATVKLPVPDARKYLKFTGYSYEDGQGHIQKIEYNEDHPEDFYYVVDTSDDFRLCEMKSCWIDYYHWEVFFMDGFNNLIEKQMVLNGEDAVEPDATKRDKFMNENPPDENHHYEFVGYDHELTNIKGPTVIRALYRIVNN